MTDSPYAVFRLLIALALMSLGSSAMYVIPVFLPVIQADFGILRADASLPYTWMMVGFGVGGILTGRLADRFGVMVPLLIGAVALGIGYALASLAQNIFQFVLIHALLIGMLGAAATFSPLIADISLWFVKRRGIAVAVVACGNYVGGVLWPPIIQHFVDTSGWRQTYLAMGILMGGAMFALALLMRRPPPIMATPTSTVMGAPGALPFGLSPNRATALLCLAGLACCVAMSMPQVHIVAYCGDLGYGAARGAEMLSLMLLFGIVSRLLSGAICDRIGGLRTLLLGSVLQGIALLLFIPFDGLVSLYFISALFGLFQGGLIPAYAIIVREHFSAKEAGARVGMIMAFTQGGMALGGWMSGKIFDLTGSYQAAFLNGIAFNLLNLAIAVALLLRASRRSRAALSETTASGRAAAR